ncbi:MAG: spermidine/putrescine transport system permease protein [Rhodospirillaceae bacterium]|nr:spermidine/putrescine transport system permease protein [Rhodospirillaceae bacterium]
MKRALPFRPVAQFLLFAGVAALPVFLVLIPLAAFLLNSFFRVENGQIVHDLTLGNYITFLSDPTYWGVLLQTLWLCARVTLICLALAFPIAWFIWRQPPGRRYLLLLLVVLPLFMSYIVKLYTMRSILGLNGLLNQMLLGLGILDAPTTVLLYNQTAVLVTLAVLFLPFVVLPVFLSLERVPASLLQASADLGASPLLTFRHVILPLALPGTIAGVLFAFVLSLGDYITPQMVGGTSGFTYGRVIWSQFGMAYDWPLGAALGVVLFLVCLVVISLAGFASRQQRV